MSEHPNRNPNRSLADLFSTCHMDDDHDIQAPQSEIEMEDDDSVLFVDANNSRSSSVILISSNASPVSYLHSSQFSSTDEQVSLEALTIEETSDSDCALVSDSRRPGPENIDMETPRLPSVRRSRNRGDHDLPIKKSCMTRPDGAAVDQALKEDDNDLAIDRFLDEMPSTSNRSVVTRSGRAVKTRINQEFDYSSSQSKGDGEEDSDDESVETEDEDYQLTNDFQEPKWTGRKRRSFETSSSSASSTDSSHSMTSIVYIELGDPVAIIRYDALANVDLNTETELKTKVHKFLGLIPPRRRLYNVLGDCDQEPDDNEHEMATLSVNCLRSPSLHSGVHPVTSSPKRAILPNATPTSTWSTVNLSHLKPPTLEERQAKICNDFVLQANANSIEEQTPDYLKEPPDLSELPSRTQMEINCRRHEISVSCMDHNRGFYRFIESLKRETSINMCHPMARSYREANFNSCKKTLAKMLYNMFNHAIFHCALMVPILWRRRMTTPCQCLLDIRSSGKRTARILLWENINEAGMLVKPLLHEMCHVAAFLFNREAGHGDNCRKWAYQSRRALPELPAIEDCDANFKYTCTMCARCSYGTMDLKKVNLRCHYCQFEVGVKPFSKTDMYEGTRPDLKLTPFKSYVRDKYLKLGEEGGTTHSSKMKLLNEEFAKMN